MSEDTPSLPYTDEEYADMIQCYLNSGKKLELTHLCYANKYYMRRKPNLATLKIVVQKYLDSLVSNDTANPEVNNFTVCSKKDDSILDYFIKNSHATVAKAASIFCVQTSYIDQLLKKRKAHTVLKGKEVESTKRQKRSVKVLSKKAAKKTKQENSDSEDQLIINKNESDFKESNIETVIIIEKSESNEIFCSEDVISETHETDIYSEASTSNMIDNYLGESTKNETQDVVNCRETAKSETDDEFICREIEYTKKRSKKYSKRSGIKKPKSSEGIISKTPVVAVYSEATTSTAADNLLREITTNESQDVGNCSETTKSETDDEVICREIEYTKNSNKKYSKRSSTKNPRLSKDIMSETQHVAVYSVATTSTTTNLLCEVNMNELQDVGNCSQTAKSETDDEFICRDIENTEKCNKKYSKCSGTKKPKSSEDIISTTQDVAVYREATTSTATHNLLREITINESQDVGNLSETAKSETDEEVMCPEIEYTKNRNEKHSKRSATKNTKSSKDIMSETQDVAVYSEATTSAATHNLLRDITINESQDVGNLSETAKSETDEEVMCPEIEYTKNRNEKHSNRSATKNTKSSEDIISEIPDDAVYSEATTSTATDNLLREITMNVSQDVGNYSERRKSETDDDVICCEMEYTKKRKKKYLKSSVSKKPKKNKKRKRKSSRQEPKTLEFSRMLNAMVYTTRLEEMAILHKKIKHLDNAIIMNDILRESKPKYNYWEHKSNMNVKRNMSFKLLKAILKKLKKNVEVVDLTDSDDLIITDVIYPANIITLNAEDTKGRSNKSDVVIVINNLFSNLRDIYVTDWKCDLIEYHCTKLNDKCDLNEFDKTKIRLILDACCWIKRHRKVESIWPRNECKFFRFLITIHKCPPDQCNCCCKPKESTSDLTLYKPSDINVFKAKSCDKYKNLILNALRYEKPDTNKNIKTHFNLHNVDIMRNIIYLLRDISKTGHCSFWKSECFEIGSNQDIVRFHTENYFRDPRQKCYQCSNMTHNRRIKEIVVCCNWKLISILNEQYKACKISANTLKFLKGMVSRRQNVCNCCKQLLSVCDSRPKTNKISNLIVNIPKVEHTRKLVKPTLLKFDKTSSRTLNNVNKVAQQILQETKYYAHRDSAIQTTKIPLAVKLKVTCNQIPGLDFELDNVNNQLATMIVAKFSNMKFSVKEDLKVVASLNNPIQTTSTEEFNIIARILLHTQNCLKLVPLPPGSNIGLVAKIIIPSDLEKNNNRDTFFSPCKNVNKGTVTVGEGDSNIIVKPTELAILKVLQAFTPFNITKRATNKNFHGQSNTDFIKTKNEKFGTDDSIEVTDDSCSYQNNAHKIQIVEQPSTKTSRRKNQATYFDEGENSSENIIQVHDVVCLNFSSDHFGSDISDINYDEAYTSKLKPYDGLANVMRCSKKCYAESFRSFLNEQKTHFETEVEKNVVLPKISSVFSLQSSAQQTQKETNESVPSTSKVDDASNNVNTETIVPTTSNNENTDVNLLNAGTPLIAGQQLMLYDPVKKNTHVVCLTPNGLLVPVANSLNTINPPIDENILSREPITIPENNSNVAVLTPIIVNQICDGNMTFIPAMQHIQEHSILPDIINDIPKNIDLRGGENNAIVVKQETKDDFVVLDSD